MAEKVQPRVAILGSNITAAMCALHLSDLQDIELHWYGFEGENFDENQYLVLTAAQREVFLPLFPIAGCLEFEVSTLYVDGKKYSLSEWNEGPWPRLVKERLLSVALWKDIRPNPWRGKNADAAWATRQAGSLSSASGLWAAVRKKDLLAAVLRRLPGFRETEPGLGVPHLGQSSLRQSALMTKLEQQSRRYASAGRAHRFLMALPLRKSTFGIEPTRDFDRVVDCSQVSHPAGEWECSSTVVDRTLVAALPEFSVFLLDPAKIFRESALLNSGMVVRLLVLREGARATLQVQRLKIRNETGAASDGIGSDDFRRTLEQICPFLDLGAARWTPLANSENKIVAETPGIKGRKKFLSLCGGFGHQPLKSELCKRLELKL